MSKKHFSVGAIIGGGGMTAVVTLLTQASEACTQLFDYLSKQPPTG